LKIPSSLPFESLRVHLTEFSRRMTPLSLSASRRMPGRGVSSKVFQSLHIRTADSVSDERCFALRGTSKTKTGSSNAINTVTTQSAGRRTRHSLLNTPYSPKILRACASQAFLHVAKPIIRFQHILLYKTPSICLFHKIKLLAYLAS